MKKYLLLFVSFFFLFPLGVGAVDLKLTYKEDFKKCYEPTLIFPSYDNSGNVDGYLFSGNVDGKYVMFKFDLNNKIVYEKTKEEVNDDNIYIQNNDSGNPSEKLPIIKCDDNNNIVFKTEYGGSGYDEFAFSFKSFNDSGEQDGYVMFFLSKSLDLNIKPGFILVKIDLKGDLVWQKNINDWYFGEGFSNLINISSSDDFIINISSDVIRKRTTDESGRYTKTVWQKNMNISPLSINYSYNKDGVFDGAVVAGVTEDGKATIIKYDLDGNEVFRSNYDTDLGCGYTSVISSKYIDGTYDGYIMTALLENGKSVIAKYDYSGKMVWKDEFDSGLKIFFMRQNYDESGNPNGSLLFPILYDDENTCAWSVFKYTYPNYEIKKDITDEGDITVSDSAYPGDTVKIKVTPKEGYVLKRIVVLDESGKEIEVSKDGTFVMPEGKVTVKAIYNRISNPETVSVCYVILGVILLISIGTLIVSKKKEA